MQPEDFSSDSFTVSISFDRSAPEIWRYLTDPGKLIQWWAEGVRLDPWQGGKFEERWQDDDGKDFLTTGEVTEVDEPTEIGLRWKEQDWPTHTHVVFRLRADEDRCSLGVTHSGWSRLAGQKGQPAKDEFEKGWKDLLAKLRALVEREEREWPPIEHRTYIEASPERVYQTLASEEGWDAWFTSGTSLDARPGGMIRLRWVDFGAGRWTIEDGGPVLIADPNRRFCFQWNPCTKPTTVDIVLTEAGSGTQVFLSEKGYPRTDADLKSMLDCAAGWGEALTLLKFYLESGQTYGEVPKGSEVDFEF